MNKSYNDVQSVIPTWKKLLIDKLETSKLLSLSVSTLDRMIRDNQIPVKRVGNRVLFSVRELEHWIEDKA
jgi:excisionase family DNA binding protein